VVHLWILPAIAQIGLVGVVHGEATIEEDPKPLGRLSVGDMDLWNPSGKVVDQMIDCMVERYLD
jgi:hypothetical protein